jgi:hypothetical protein
VTSTDWWADLYDARYGDTTATVTPPAVAGHRLPPPGSVVDLDADVPDAGEELDAEDAEDAYEEFDDDGELDDDETDDEIDAEPRIGAARFHPRRVREHVAEHHGEQRQRLRHLAYNGSAAVVSWGLGWEESVHAVLVDCGRETGDPYAAIVLGVAAVGAAVVLIDRRTRGWWGPLAWICRIPAASAVLALALYTPAVTL